jgi:MSHA biogenesis protein MshI
MAITIPWLGKSKLKSGRVGLAIGPDGLAVASVNAQGHVVHYQFVDQISDLAYTIADIVEQQGWEQMPCSVVLHSAYYQLLLTERPPVELQEMASAVRWKVKELLDYPIEGAAIEFFSLPDDAYRGRQKMLYVAALPKDSLQSLIAPVEASGLQVDCVEISELAVHNIASLYPRQGGGIAIVKLREGESFINLIEGGSLYLTRRLDISLDKFDPNSDNTVFFDSLFLEIQRSLDFYESQLGKGIITRLFYCPGIPETASIGEFLSKQLGLDVAPLDASQFDFIDGDVESHLAHCTTAIGAALGPVQQEAENAAS